MARAGAASLTFLTIVPIGRRVQLSGADVARGSVAFPIVGCGIGALGGVVDWALGRHAPAMLAAVVAVAITALITGGLHLDGLADYADSFGGRTVEDRLRIMRDHAIGTYGGLALMLDLLIRTSALAAVAGTGHAIAFGAAAGAVSRSCGPVLSAMLPYAQRSSGSGSALSTYASKGRAVAATVLSLILALLAVGLSVWVVAVATALVLASVSMSASRRLGGVTGDVMGAASELVEITTLAVLASLL
ncbi:MAG: adenosylcobinamide-GDP ribazoletransferase [Jatrophihabitantaceae bacterium]